MDIGSVTIVESMHERKEMMAANSDAFVALPGGFGTLDELVEIITWVNHRSRIYITEYIWIYMDIYRYTSG